MKFPLKITKADKKVLEQIEKDILTFDYSKQRSIFSSGEIYTFKVDDTMLVDANDEKVLWSDLLNTIDDYRKCRFNIKLLVEVILPESNCSAKLQLIALSEKDNGLDKSFDLQMQSYEAVFSLVDGKRSIERLYFM